MTDSANKSAVSKLTQIRPLAASRRGTIVLAALAAFAICLTHGLAKSFVYDAFNYWSGAVELASGRNPYTVGLLDLRGTLTTVVYLPSALLVKLVGTASAGAAVLVQNALLIAALGTLIVPGIVKVLTPIRGIHVWASALICSVLLSGFAQYPLMDIWAATLTLLGILLIIRSDSWWSLLIGGIAFGVAINLRPAYLVPVLLTFIVWLVVRWRRGLWPLRGFLIALVPQVLVNHSVSGVWDAWPLRTAYLNGIQSTYASFVVRYDTVAFVGGLDPRQAYCDPNWAKTVSSQPTPNSSVDLATSYLHNLPSSIVFAAEKIAASFHWSLATPYASPAPATFNILTPVVILLSSIGFVAIVRCATQKSANLPVSLMLLAFWAGSVATVAFSQPETRFAVPMVLIGAIGCLLLIPSEIGGRFRRSILFWSAGALVLAIALFTVGEVGLAHAAPPGDVTALICSKT